MTPHISRRSTRTIPFPSASACPMDSKAGGLAKGNAKNDYAAGANCVPSLILEEAQKRSQSRHDAAVRARDAERPYLLSNESAELSLARRLMHSRDVELAVAHRRSNSAPAPLLYQQMTALEQSTRLAQQREQLLAESAHRRARSDWRPAENFEQQTVSSPAESVAWSRRRMDLLHHLIRCEEQTGGIIGQQRLSRREPASYNWRGEPEQLGNSNVPARSMMFGGSFDHQRARIGHSDRRQTPERVSSARPYKRSASEIVSEGLQKTKCCGPERVDSCPQDQKLAPRASPKLQPLALPSDIGIFSGSQQLIRQSILVFGAEPKDIDFFANSQGRNKRVALGQVGLRCRYCAERPLHWCGRGAVYFPGSVSTIYQAAQNMATNHFLSGCCEDMPEEIRDAFSTEIENKKHKKAKRSAGKEYWECACRSLGLEDRPGHYGVWYRSR